MSEIKHPPTLKRALKACLLGSTEVRGELEGSDVAGVAHLASSPRTAITDADGVISLLPPERHFFFFFWSTPLRS